MMPMQLNIIIACDKYKGSLSAVQVCETIKNSILEISNKINIITCPMADGGEGTVDTLVESQKGKYIELFVKDPLGKKIKSRFGIINDSTAVIEMSSASGLTLLSVKERNPLKTTTYGTGEMIKKAIELGCKTIILGIGGSATTDAGMGIGQALGVEFYDKKSNALGFGGGELLKLESIDLSKINHPIKDIKIIVACDIDNPLYGPNGAAYVFGPQKGADENMVKILDEGLKNFAKVVKNNLKKRINNIKGAGAAGGVGAGLVAFFNAELKSGADIVIDLIKLEDRIKDSDLVITGEGSMDNQTFYGKSSFAVAKLGKKYKIPVISINGSVNIDYNNIANSKKNLFSGNFDIINKPMSLNFALENSKCLINSSTKEIINFFLSVRQKYLGHSE